MHDRWGGHPIGGHAVHLEDDRIREVCNPNQLDRLLDGIDLPETRRARCSDGHLREPRETIRRGGTQPPGEPCDGRCWWMSGLLCGLSSLLDRLDHDRGRALRGGEKSTTENQSEGRVRHRSVFVYVRSGLHHLQIDPTIWIVRVRVDFARSLQSSMVQITISRPMHTYGSLKDTTTIVGILQNYCCK